MRPLKASIIGSKRAQEFDEFVASAGGGACVITQSWDWGVVRKHLGWDPVRILVEDDRGPVASAQVLLRRLPAGVGSIAFVPSGPVGAWLEPEVGQCLLGKIDEVAREAGAIFLKVEPPLADSPEARRAVCDLGFAERSHSMGPMATVVVDLTPDLEEIFRSFSSSTRALIRRAERKGLVVREGGPEDLGVLYEFLRTTAERTGMNLRNFEHYETEYQVFAEKGDACMRVAEFEGEVVSIYTAHRFGDVMVGIGPGASRYSLPISPPSTLIWELMKWGKAQGVRSLDLWGAPAEVRQMVAAGKEIPKDRTDGAWGYYQFKTRFGGRLVTYAGSFDRVYAPIRFTGASHLLAQEAVVDRLGNLMEALRSRR